jgi:hypothetical protein
MEKIKAAWAYGSSMVAAYPQVALALILLELVSTAVFAIA